MRRTHNDNNSKNSIHLPKASHQKGQVPIKAGSVQKKHIQIKHKLNTDTAYYVD